MRLSTIRFSDDSVARYIRQIPKEKPEYYLDESKKIKIKYIKTCTGTPRREYKENIINRIRLKPTYNPYHEITDIEKNKIKTWKSRNWENWTPNQCYIGDNNEKKYNIPEDIKPSYNELGELENPVLTNEDIDDIKKQYIINGYPWVWDENFYNSEVKEYDKEPTVCPDVIKKPKLSDATKEALRSMENTRMSYLQEKHDRRHYNWWESVVKELGGEDFSAKYARLRKIPRLL